MVRIALSNVREKSNELLYPGPSSRSRANILLVDILHRVRVGSGCRQLVGRVWLRLAGKDIKGDKSEGAEDLEGGERILI